jgi:hypothetical protein
MALVKDIPYDKDLIKAIDKFEAEIKNRLSIKDDSNVTSKETNTAGDSLNWKLIFIFCLRIFVVLFCVEFIFGIIKGFRHDAPLGFPDWLQILDAIAVLLVLCVIFRSFFRIQQEHATLHACMIAFLSWALPLPLNMLLTKKPLSTWFGALLVYAIAIPLGALASRWGNPISNKFP